MAKEKQITKLQISALGTCLCAPPGYNFFIKKCGMVKFPWCESCKERKFLGYERSSKERMFQGTRVPWSESSPYGLFAPASFSAAAFCCAALAVVQCLCVCQSVCSSFTFVDSVKTNKHICKICSPSGSYIPLHKFLSARTIL